MASTASISIPVNNPSSPVATSTSSQKDGGSRSVKANQASRMTQKGRKESPSDSNRQSTSGAPKAWSGTNPITQQRASTPSQNQNKSNAAQNKTMPAAKSQSTKDVLSDKHNYDRLRFLLGGSVGLQVVFVTKAGDKYEGVFAGFAGSKISLKMTKKVINNPITQPNGSNSSSSWEAAFTGSSPDFAMTFDLKDMADLTIPEFSLPETARQTNGASTSFQTDTDISGNTNRAERTLQRWVPDPSDTGDFSLESGSATGWDQFATHAAMTGGQSSYVEELYTTTIDRNAPDFRRREAQAAKIAREIEAAPSANAHVREERGQALENDFGDEEDKYSGVRRAEQNYQPLATSNANRYVPPSMRAPSGQPTTSGAPFDPAIISSQIARPEGSQAATSTNTTKPPSQARAVSSALPQSDQPLPIDRSIDLSKLTANGSVGKAAQPKQMVSPPPERQEAEPPSQGVERKVLGAYKQFVEVERARIAEKRRIQANQDRTAKINDLIRFSTTFKLKTPVPEDLVGILAKDPKKQEAIIEKAKRDHDDAKTTPPSTASSSSSSQLPTVPKFDKSQIPPPIPERSALVGGKGTFPKAALGRGSRVPGQPLPFGGANVPVAPRAAGSKAAAPTPIPMPEVKSHQSTAGNSGVSSPRGIDTPTSAVSTKFKFNPAAEFRPTFAPSTASVSAASPSPIKRVVQPARSASPASFFGQRKPIQDSQRLDLAKNFNPIKRMHEEVKTRLAEGSEDKRDFAANGGIPNAYHTAPTWMVPADNQEKTHEDFFRSTPAMSPSQSRSGSHQTLPFQAQMQHMAGGPHIPQAVTPQHGHHGPHYQQHFDDQRMHMPNGSPSMFASPNMTPRGAYASPMGHPAQPGYGHQSYFGVNGPMPGRPYSNNAAMMHGQHGQISAPMMMQQQSSGPYMGMQNPMGMVFPSPRVAHAFPQQQNGYPSPGPMAPVMMHQGSQQGYGNQSMMYANTGMYGGHPQMGRGYGGNHTPYGSSPHQPHHLGQRAMSSGYGQKIPQVPTGPPSNAPQQPAAFGQAGVREEAK